MSLRRTHAALVELAASLPLQKSAWWRWDGERVQTPEELAAAAGIPLVEAKARWVRTAAGARKFGQPIGTIIVPDADGSWEPFDLEADDAYLAELFGEPALRQSGPRVGDRRVGRHHRLARPEGDDREGPAHWVVDDHGAEDEHKLFPDKNVGTAPITHVYRAVSLSEWNQAVERGYIQSDKRGVIADWEGTNAAVESASARSYLSYSEPSVIVRLRVDPADKWFTIYNDGYLRTRERIPLDRIEAVSDPYRYAPDPNSRYGRTRLERYRAEAKGLELKVRRVRTPEGSRFFKLPIGAPIVADAEPGPDQYVPGRWWVKGIDRESMIQDSMARFLDAHRQLRGDEPISDDDMASMREYYAEEIDERLSRGATKHREVFNGPHRVSYNSDEVSEEDIGRLLDLLDQLQAMAPVTKLNINIRDYGFVEAKGLGGEKIDSSHVRGQTVRGTGNIDLRPDIFNDWKVHPALSREVERHHMPVAAQVDQMTYVVTHEWGHAIDNWDNSQAITMWGEGMKAGPDGLGDMSSYGEFSPRESLAEAFTELVLTGGQTQNQTALSYLPYFRGDFGWRGDAWD